MLTVIVRGGTNEGKTTIAAAIVNTLSAMGLNCNVVDPDYEQIKSDNARLLRNVRAVATKLEMFKQSILVHTEDEAHPVNHCVPFGMIQVTDRTTEKPIMLIRKHIVNIAPIQGGTFTLITSQYGDHPPCFHEVKEEVTEVRDRMKGCEWGEKTDILSLHIVRSAKESLLARK